MLVQGLAELAATVGLAALGKEVQDPPAGPGDPVDALSAIDEPQHLDPLRQPPRGGPVDDVGNSLQFPRRDPCRGHLDAVNPDLVQQRHGDVRLLVRGEGDPLGLFTIAERGVHDQNRAGGIGHARVSVGIVGCGRLLDGCRPRGHKPLVRVIF